jgi:hypothetical protein
MVDRKPTVVLMFSGGVDSVVCIHELVKQGFVPKLFFFRTYKVKDSHVRLVRRNAKRLSPNSEFYIFSPRTIDFLASWQSHATAKHAYFVHMDEYEANYIYPLRYCDRLAIGYVNRECKGRRKGETGRAQPEFMKQCLIYHRDAFLFPLLGKTTREVDQIFNSLPEDVKRDTVSTTRNYAFGGAYIHG